uniref:Uncharacterized protein n=1 Tax=Megaviridae environmental sample TaxID=1737588 RepID=A0A5J6VI82_9VIRU|nr:MAG: hypothetical protein [Megaviridae environmental sample]
MHGLVLAVECTRGMHNFDVFSRFYEGELSSVRTGHNFDRNTIEQTLKYSTLNNIERRLGNAMLKFNTTYIVVFKRGDVHTLKHELAHARYHIDAEYRFKIDKLWRELTRKQQTTIVGFLNRCGYPPHVHMDEFQAYATTEKSNFFGVYIDGLNNLNKKVFPHKRISLRELV